MASAACYVAQAPIRQYDPNDLHSEGTIRGKVLFDLLQRHGVPLTHGRLLDLGCGYGGYSLHAARNGAAVTAVDIYEDKLEAVSRRAAAETWPNGGGVAVLKADATTLPLESATFDQALSLGVIEWVPLTSPGGDPREVQVRALREIARLLKPGGTYILGTKNRWYPNYGWRSAQERWPLVNHLPRRAAQVYSRLLYGQEYRTYIHSQSGWQTMLHEAGFRSVQAFLPVYHYQFPIDLWPSGTRGHSLARSDAAAAQWIPAEYRRMAERGHADLKKSFLSAVSRAGLEQLFWPAFIFVATK